MRKESIIYKTLLPEILQILKKKHTKKTSWNVKPGDKTPERAWWGLTHSAGLSTPRQDSHQVQQEVFGVRGT